MSELKDSVDDSMIGGDMSLKGKIIKEREKHIEKKTYDKEILLKNS
jgi:hypothetical protein